MFSVLAVGRGCNVLEIKIHQSKNKGKYELQKIVQDLKAAIEIIVKKYEKEDIKFHYIKKYKS